jgi:hypothetical protein
MAEEHKRPTVTYEELAYSTMLQVQALVELLEEKGILTQREILQRVKRLQAQAAKRPMWSSLTIAGSRRAA